MTLYICIISLITLVGMVACIKYWREEKYSCTTNGLEMFFITFVMCPLFGIIAGVIIGVFVEIIGAWLLPIEFGIINVLLYVYKEEIGEFIEEYMSK